MAEKPHHFAGVLHSFTWDYLFSESIMLGGNQLDTLVELSSKNYASQIDDNFSDKLLRHKLKSLYQMLRYGGMDLTNIDAPEGPEMYKSIHNLPIWKNK